MLVCGANDIVVFWIYYVYLFFRFIFLFLLGFFCCFCGIFFIINDLVYFID